MDTDLIAWLVKNKNKNTTGDWVKDGHIWIKFFLPEDKCSSMCSTSDKGEELVMSVFRVKEILVLGKEILQIVSASGRWSHGSLRQIRDGSSSCTILRRLYTLRESPSMFQVRFVRNSFLLVFASDRSVDKSDLSEQISLKTVWGWVVGEWHPSL